VTWARALLCWLAAGLLALVYLGSAPAPAPAPMPKQVAAAAPAPAASPAESLPGYVLDPATLARVEVRRGETAVVLARAGDRWQVQVPTDRVIPGGLVQAFVDQLVDSGHGERIAEDPQDPAFGFTTPQVVIETTDQGGARLRLVVGAPTPTGAAAYALLEPDGRVVLLGRNLLYYADLLLG